MISEHYGSPNGLLSLKSIKPDSKASYVIFSAAPSSINASPVVSANPYIFVIVTLTVEVSPTSGFVASTKKSLKSLEPVTPTFCILNCPCEAVV